MTSAATIFDDLIMEGYYKTRGEVMKHHKSSLMCFSLYYALRDKHIRQKEFDRGTSAIKRYISIELKSHCMTLYSALEDVSGIQFFGKAGANVCLYIYKNWNTRPKSGKAIRKVYKMLQTAYGEME